jgi:hypothetical protein
MIVKYDELEEIRGEEIVPCLDIIGYYTFRAKSLWKS